MDYYKKYLKYKKKYFDLKNSYQQNNEQSGAGNHKFLIIHILGPSGSGKTTLGDDLAFLPNTISLDTDDIDDKNAIKLLSKYNIENKEEDRLFNKERKRLNKKDINKFISNNKDKNIILVGFAFQGMEIISKVATHKFSINIDPDSLFRQYQLRSLDYITKNNKDIEKLLKNKKISIDKIVVLLTLKYKIRHGFKCENSQDVRTDIKRRNKEAKEKGYKVLSSDEIYEEVSDAINNLYPLKI